MGITHGRRREIRSGPESRVAPHIIDVTVPLTGGTLTSNGVQYGPVATVTATGPLAEAWSKLIDPYVDLNLIKTEFGITFRGENIDATSQTTLYYRLMARENTLGTQKSWIDITGTQSEAIPTDGTSGDQVDLTFSGLVPAGSLPAAPFDFKIDAAVSTFDKGLIQMKGSSYIRLVGVVIPGTG